MQTGNYSTVQVAPYVTVGNFWEDCGNYQPGQEIPQIAIRRPDGQHGPSYSDCEYNRKCSETICHFKNLGADLYNLPEAHLWQLNEMLHDKQMQQIPSGADMYFSETEVPGRSIVRLPQGWLTQTW